MARSPLLLGCAHALSGVRLVKSLLKTALIMGALMLSQLLFAQARVICRYVIGADLNAIATRYGITFLDRTPRAPFVLYLCEAKYLEQYKQKLMRDPGIAWAEEDGKVSIPEAVGQKGGSIPVIGDRTTLYQRNALMLQQIGWNSNLAFSTGRPVTLSILDTGLSPNQPALWSKVVASANFVETSEPYDVLQNEDTNGNGLADEAVGHGTMVAGVVDQIAPNVNLAIARVADSDGFATAWSIIKGLTFSVNAQAEVANISLGTLNHIRALEKALEWCDEKNLTVVAAIGNDGTNRAAYPAKIGRVIGVGGLLPDDTKAPFSNWDHTCDASAPATGIYSQSWTGELGLWSGTSFAAPMVSGAIADCLRRTGSVPTRSWLSSLAASGRNIDRINLRYRGQLGSGLDIAALDTILQTP